MTTDGIFYLEDCRAIQQNIAQIENRTFEIERCLQLGADAKDQIDAAVRFAQETKTMIDKFKNFARPEEPSRVSQFRLFSSQLQTVVGNLESSVSKYRRPVQPEFVKNNNPFTPGSHVSSDDMHRGMTTLQDGGKAAALTDLRRVEREMGSLQKIYQQLHAQAVEQQGSIELISHNMAQAVSSTDGANKELLLTQQSKDRRLYWKLFIAGFIVVILFLYVYLSR